MESAEELDPTIRRALSPLGPDVGCGNALSWRCDLELEPPVDLVETMLVAMGYRSVCAHPALKVLRHPDGHEIAWVIRTGRVQLRIALQIEGEDRGQIASHVYRDLEAAVSRSLIAETPISRSPGRGAMA